MLWLFYIYVRNKSIVRLPLCAGDTISISPKCHCLRVILYQLIGLFITLTNLQRSPQSCSVMRFALTRIMTRAGTTRAGSSRAGRGQGRRGRGTAGATRVPHALHKAIRRTCALAGSRGRQAEPRAVRSARARQGQERGRGAHVLVMARTTTATGGGEGHDPRAPRPAQRLGWKGHISLGTGSRGNPKTC